MGVNLSSKYKIRGSSQEECNTTPEPARSKRVSESNTDVLFPAEAEIARRIGKSSFEWRQIAVILERDGLSPIDPLMGGRYWPAVVAFFSRRYGLSTLSPLQADGEENLDALR